MIYSEDTTIDKIVIHAVGNKQNNEPLLLSHDLLHINEKVKELLISYFIPPFSSNEYFQFYHGSALHLNETFHHVSDIFENPELFYEKSLELAKFLYDKSTHPKIKNGELYVVYFKNLLYEDTLYDAVGIFKAENKDTFLKVFQDGDNFLLETEAGININKLDKGCIVFNCEKEDGFMVSVVDNTNRGLEAQYWMDDFLQVRQRKNEFYNTQNVMNLCKEFVVNRLPEEVEISKSDQVNLLKKSVAFFKENENFDMPVFAKTVIEEPEIIESFNDFKTQYEEEKDVEIADNFSISSSAVKKESKNFRSVIKLDNNFHIYVHGNSQLMKRGVDDVTGMSYYQIFFNEEKF